MFADAFYASLKYGSGPIFGANACMNIMKERDRRFNLYGDDIWMDTHPNLEAILKTI